MTLGRQSDPFGAFPVIGGPGYPGSSDVFNAFNFSPPTGTAQNNIFSFQAPRLPIYTDISSVAGPDPGTADPPAFLPQLLLGGNPALSAETGVNALAAYGGYRALSAAWTATPYVAATPAVPAVAPGVAWTAGPGGALVATPTPGTAGVPATAASGGMSLATRVALPVTAAYVGHTLTTNAIDHYANQGDVSGATAAGIIGGGATGAAVGALTVVAIANSWNPVGWILGAALVVGAACAIGYGIYAHNKATAKQAEIQANDAKAREEATARNRNALYQGWDQMVAQFKASLGGSPAAPSTVYTAEVPTTQSTTLAGSQLRLRRFTEDFQGFERALGLDRSQPQAPLPPGVLSEITI